MAISWQRAFGCEGSWGIDAYPAVFDNDKTMTYETWEEGLSGGEALLLVLGGLSGCF